MKTSALIGPALDWAVAKIEGYDLTTNWPYRQIPEYSTRWSQGGPIIERERITVWNNEVWWHAAYNDGTDDIYGQTPLIAAMRCLVSAKLGDEVEIPEELA